MIARALRITVTPEAEWRRIAAMPPDSGKILTGFILPLCCVPALSWTAGLALFGGAGIIGHESEVYGPGRVVQGGVLALAGCVASIYLLATFLFLLSPVFSRPRNWPRALEVAAYSSAPVLLAGVVLVLPDLAYTLVIAAIHAFYLQYGGVQHLLGIAETRAAEYVALVTMSLMVASTLLGGIGSAAGLL